MSKKPLLGPRHQDQVTILNKSESTIISISLKMSLCLSNLLLTGSATPFLHNGVTENDADIEEIGIVARNAIGFLMWDRTSETTQKHKLGSRFKTPHLPIWVTCVNNKWGVLFNPKLDLMKSHAAENR